jgi:hypothetical protein
VDARRRVHTLQNAPQVLFRNDPPLELEGIPGLKQSGDGKISYITFGKTILEYDLSIEQNHLMVACIQSYSLGT